MHISSSLKSVSYVASRKHSKLSTSSIQVAILVDRGCVFPVEVDGRMSFELAAADTRNQNSNLAYTERESSNFRVVASLEASGLRQVQIVRMWRI
jgi:hypothetical protein